MKRWYMALSLSVGMYVMSLATSMAVSPMSQDTLVVAVDTLATQSYVADSIGLASMDSVQAEAIDSLQLEGGVGDTLRFEEISLDGELSIVDSTALIMEKVKSVTDMISMKSVLNSKLVENVFSDTAIVNKYNRLLAKMVGDYEREVKSFVGDSIEVNPVFFRLFAPLTLYDTPVNRAMAMDTLIYGNGDFEADARLVAELDRVLLYTYLNNPELVKQTEEGLRKSVGVAEAVVKGNGSGEKIALDIPTTKIEVIGDKGIVSPTDVVVAKPNFWVTKGSFSTQITESYFSPNWYQGGINNLNVLSMLTLEANYNNKRKVQWDNKLDARIGFYQNQGEEVQSNQDLLRLTSKLNLRAIRNWNYTVEAQGNTQMMNHYKGNDRVDLKSSFLAPADASLTIGMDFKKSFKKGSISIYPGPLSYKMTYVAKEELAKDYGLDKGKKIRSDLGSKLEVNFDYKITGNISYKTRFYYFTGRYEYVQMDWENTLNFLVSKYISTKLFFHTRFDDLVDINPEYANWRYYQFKQYLMFGLNYSW